MTPQLQNARGQLLMRRERGQLRAALPHLFGYRLLQVGAWGTGHAALDASATLCQWIAGGPEEAGVDLCFDGSSLPVTSKCLDAVVLPHSLERSADPHRLLREVDRVLCDHGHVLILGFNPYSPWALGRRLRHPHAAREARFYPMGRVIDWLDLLDFEVTDAVRYGVGFPWLPADGVASDDGGWRRLPGMLAQAYRLVARKRVVRMTPLADARRRRAGLASGVPEPSSRVSHGARRLAA